MRYRLISLAAVAMAIVGWWGLHELTGKVGPGQPGGLPLFFALLFLALTATLTPPSAYLNRRFAPKAVAADPARFLRHSAWAGLCLTAWAWLQVHRVFNLGFALVIALIFVALEFLIVHLRAEAGDNSAENGYRPAGQAAPPRETPRGAAQRVQKTKRN